MTSLVSNTPTKTYWSPLVVTALVATWFVWGSMYLAIQWALVSFPAFFQMGTQFLLAGLLLLIFSRLKGSPWPNKNQWIAGAVLGFLLLGAGYGFTAMAESSVSSGLVVAFIAVVPTLIALFEWPYGVRPNTRQLIGILIGLCGIVMLTLGQGFQASLGGLLAITTSCVAWAIGSVWSVHGMPGGIKLTVAPGGMGYACQMLTGGVMLLAASALIGERPSWPPETTAVLSWAYLMVAGSLISYTAYMVLLERTTPSLAASYTYVNPIVALTLGVTLNHELVTRFEWSAVAIVLIGVILLLWRQDRPNSSLPSQ
jgi:drug/metabolite transporter (DMT)-like permease